MCGTQATTEEEKCIQNLRGRQLLENVVRDRSLLAVEVFPLRTLAFQPEHLAPGNK